MRTLLAGKVARFHVYDFVTHSRLPNEYIHVHPADVVLFEGILVFYFPELRNLFQLKLFVDTDADTRLARRGESVYGILFELQVLSTLAFVAFSVNHWRTGHQG